MHLIELIAKIVLVDFIINNVFKNLCKTVNNFLKHNWSEKSMIVQPSHPSSGKNSLRYISQLLIGWKGIWRMVIRRLHSHLLLATCFLNGHRRGLHVCILWQVGSLHGWCCRHVLKRRRWSGYAEAGHAKVRLLGWWGNWDGYKVLRRLKECISMDSP